MTTRLPTIMRNPKHSLAVSARPHGCAARLITALRLIHIEECHDARTQTPGDEDLEAPG